MSAFYQDRFEPSHGRSVFVNIEEIQDLNKVTMSWETFLFDFYFKDKDTISCYHLFEYIEYSMWSIEDICS